MPASVELRPAHDVVIRLGQAPDRYRDVLRVDAYGRNAYDGSMKAIVSEKGQVTIPKAVRSKLGLRPGTVIEFEADRGRLIGRKADGRDVIDELYGSLKIDEPVDAYIERIRGR